MTPHYTHSQVAQFRRQFARRLRALYVPVGLLVVSRFVWAAGRIFGCAWLPCRLDSWLGLSDRGWFFLTVALLVILVATVLWAARCPACGGLVWRFGKRHKSCGVDLRPK